VLEYASVVPNPNQANYITPCMESIAGASKKERRSKEEKQNNLFYHDATAPSGLLRRGFIITRS
jgi:hypothetical protein